MAARVGADFVELDVVKGTGGTFFCGHGLGRRSKLEDCLAEVGSGMGLVAHLKGRFGDADLIRLAEEVTRHVALEEVVFAAHRIAVLCRLRELVPGCRLARFGLFPAIVALWKKPLWECAMISQQVLLKCHVAALRRKGILVFASCVWEFRSRRTVEKTGVDGMFVNLLE